MSIQINGTSGISGVDGSAGTPALQGSDSNTGISFGTDTVNINTGGTTRATVDSSGRLLVGTTTSRGNFFNTTGLDPRVQIEGSDGLGCIYSAIGNFNGSGGEAQIFLSKSRGTTVGSNTIVQNGDGIGAIQFQGSDGSEFVQAAEIKAWVDGTPGANSMPGRITLSTTASGASSPTERMRITQAGYFRASKSGSGAYGGGNYHEFNNDQNDWTLVVRNVNNSSGSGVVINYPSMSPNSAGSQFLYCSDSTTLRAEIRSNGGLANYSANNANLSDRNAKKDISPAAGTWDCIKEWEIVNYRYKDQPDDADLNLGVIAQQVAESCPEVITVFQEAKEATEDQPAQEERLGVKEQQMYWMAIKALQEAQVRIEQLEAEVAALKAQ